MRTLILATTFVAAMSVAGRASGAVSDLSGDEAASNYCAMEPATAPASAEATPDWCTDWAASRYDLCLAVAEWEFDGCHSEFAGQWTDLSQCLCKACKKNPDVWVPILGWDCYEWNDEIWIWGVWGGCAGFNATGWCATEYAYDLSICA